MSLCDNCNSNSCTYDKNIILPILEYLYNAKLLTSFITLENETSIYLFKYPTQISFLRKLIFDGEWEQTLTFLAPLHNNNNNNTSFNYNEALFLIYRQQFLESIENINDGLLTNESLLEKKLNTLKQHSTKEQFMSIMNILNKGSIKACDEYKEWSVLKGRYKVFEAIRNMLSYVYALNKDEINIKQRNVLSNVLNVQKETITTTTTNNTVIQGISGILEQKKRLTNNNNNNTSIKRPQSSLQLQPQNKQHLCYSPIKSSYSTYPLYDISSFSLETLLVDTQAIRTATFNNQGNYLAIGTNSKSLKIYSLTSVLKKFINRNQTTSVAHAQLQSSSASLPLAFEKSMHHQGSIYCVDWSSKGKLLATGSNDKLIKIIVTSDFSNKEVLEMQIPGHKGTVRTLLFDPQDEHTLLSGGTVDNNIMLWDTEEGKQRSLLVNGHNDDIHSIKSCVDTKHIELVASCSKDGNVCVWDFNRNNKPIRTINTNERGYGCVNDITFTSEYVVSAHVKGKVAVWDMQSGKLLNEIDYAHNNNGTEVRSVNVSLDGKYLLCCGFDQKVKIFDVVNEFKVIKVLEHDDRVVSCKWHPVIPCFVSTSADKTARLWLPNKY